MHLLASLTRLMSRFRYPVSLPEDIAGDLGMHAPNSLDFKEFLELLASPHSRPAHLRRYMPRLQAEAAFRSALRKEQFPTCTLFSYYFSRGWVVIALYYDEHSRLRRAHLQCPACENKESFDLMLEEEELLVAASSQ